MLLVILLGVVLFWLVIAQALGWPAVGAIVLGGVIGMIAWMWRTVGRNESPAEWK